MPVEPLQVLPCCDFLCPKALPHTNSIVGGHTLDVGRKLAVFPDESKNGLPTETESARVYSNVSHTRTLFPIEMDCDVPNLDSTLLEVPSLAVHGGRVQFVDKPEPSPYCKLFSGSYLGPKSLTELDLLLEILLTSFPTPPIGKTLDTLLNHLL